jgi:hypothetical protein
LWKVQEHDHHDFDDPEDYASVRARDVEEAAEKYAESHDDECLLLNTPEGWTLLITDEDGKKTRVNVKAEATVEYTAEIEDEADDAEAEATPDE